MGEGCFQKGTVTHCVWFGMNVGWREEFHVRNRELRGAHNTTSALLFLESVMRGKRHADEQGGDKRE